MPVRKQNWPWSNVTFCRVLTGPALFQSGLLELNFFRYIGASISVLFLLSSAHFLSSQYLAQISIFALLGHGCVRRLLFLWSATNSESKVMRIFTSRLTSSLLTIPSRCLFCGLLLCCQSLSGFFKSWWGGIDLSRFCLSCFVPFVYLCSHCVFKTWRGIRLFLI